MNIGKDLLGPAWDEFKSLMDDAHATFSQKSVIWEKHQVFIDRFQEDSEEVVTTQELLVLLNYNYRRTWPLNITTESGEDDEQSIQMFINKEYLRVNNLLDVNGAFNYNEDYDRFIIDGTKYKAFGDTPASQMKSDDVFITVLLKRVGLETGTKR